MRSEDEKKTVIKSLKMTKNECSIIEEKAKESGKSFSRYVVDSATSESGKTLRSENRLRSSRRPLLFNS